MKSIKYAMMMYLLTGAVSMQGMDDANKVVIRELKSIEELQSIVNEKPYITALIVKSSAEIETLIEPFRKLIATKAPRSYRTPIWRAEDYIAINVDKVPEFFCRMQACSSGKIDRHHLPLGPSDR